MFRKWFIKEGGVIDILIMIMKEVGLSEFLWTAAENTH